MEIEILRNTKTNRIILIDKRTNQAFLSLGKAEVGHAYISEHYKEEIKDYKPVKIK